jgi:hypothetical protein
MIHTSNVISIVAISTITVDCCNSDHDGQLTFSNNSLYDSRKYVVILFILKMFYAPGGPSLLRGAPKGTGTRIRTQTEGFGDLCTTVILYPSVKEAKSYPNTSGQLLALQRYKKNRFFQRAPPARFLT